MDTKKRDEEEKKLNKAKKQRSSAIIGSSLVYLTQLCMPKCIDLKQATVSSYEKICLQKCVKSLHKTQTRTFEFLMDFE